jgi:hypothetical protein
MWRREAVFISTPKGFNYLYDLYNLQAAHDNYKRFHFPSYNNPHIKSEELDAATATRVRRSPRAREILRTSNGRDTQTG